MDRNNLINQLIGEQIKTIFPIKEGISNKNYLVNNKYVVRIKENKEKFYSYKNEKNVIHNIARLHQNERVIYLDKDGNKVSDYIKNLKPISYKNSEIKKTAELLKNLHTLEIKIKNKFTPIKRFKYYKYFSRGEKFSHEKYILNEFKKIYKKYPLVICHNDVVKNNILFNNERAYLIDYEYAGKNIFLFDLGSFISENNLNDKQAKMFLDAYEFDKEKNDDLTKVIIFENLLWFYWALERYKKTKDKIYLKISDEKKDNIKKDINYLLNKKIIF